MDLSYLKELYQLKPTEEQTLSYLNQHFESLDELNIRTVAKDCFTSPSSIVRLAKKLNLSGYNELIYKIKESNLPSPEIDKTGISEKEISYFIQLMKENSGSLIVVLGLSFCAHIAAYISDVLNFHFVPSIATTHTQMVNHQPQQPYLFIVVTHSGEEKELKETIRIAKQNGNAVIAFLGTSQSSIAKKSDLVFSTESYSPFSSSVAQPQLFFGRTLILFEALISSYFNAKD